MANEEYIEVEFDVFEYTGQSARVKRNLTVGVLIDEILREFDDIPSDPTNRYVLYLKGLDKPLDNEKTLTDLDIQPQDELVFDRYRTFLRQDLPEEINAYFVEEKSAEVFDVHWQPAIIGRSSTDIDHNFLLAVNLQFLPEGKTISRRHAVLTYANRRFWLEPQTGNNPVYLNGKEMPFGKKFEIKDGDKIRLGFNLVTLTFKLRKISISQNIPTDPGVAVKEAPHQTEVQMPAQEKADSATLMVDQQGGTSLVVAPELVIETVSNPQMVGQVIQLVSFPMVIGRNHPMLVFERDISRQHLEFIFDPRANKYYIRDMNSTNGVWLNEQKITPNIAHEIEPGSRIRLGKLATFLFRG